MMLVNSVTKTIRYFLIEYIEMTGLLIHEDSESSELNEASSD
jgi:hypothetical protein